MGNWIGTYGTTGYVVVDNATKYPSFATVEVSGARSGTWTTTTNLQPALESVAGTGRIAAAWYASKSFSLDVDIRTAGPEDVAVYALDWGNAGIREQIQVSNAVTGAILDTEVISNFSKGVYLQWSVCGNVDITVRRLAGPMAVLSGLFFDAPGSGNSPTGSAVNAESTPTVARKSAPASQPPASQRRKWWPPRHGRRSW